MANNGNLRDAKKHKEDEYYTTYENIESEMNEYFEYNKEVFKGKTILCPCDDPEWSEFTRYFASNFKFLGLKKLICTSYAKSVGNKQVSLFEKESPIFDAEKHQKNGKLFVLDHNTNNLDKVNINDLKFSYLNGDGDFRSEEVTKLRDEADIIITNPPFSLFREFLAWIMENNKKFIIIGSKNAISYKEIFPLLKNNTIWLGPGFPGGNAFFKTVSDNHKQFVNGVFDDSTGLVKFRNVCWFTNIDHGLRHKPIDLSTMKDNLRYNKKLIKKFTDLYMENKYPYYDNYDAIEVPFTNAIPKDYDGIMGVPITFLDQYCPEQFEIIGGFNGYKECDYENSLLCGSITEYIDKNGKRKKWTGPTVNKKTVYYRILIKRKG